MTSREALRARVRRVRRRSVAVAAARAALAGWAGLAALVAASALAVPWAPPEVAPWVVLPFAAAGAVAGIGAARLAWLGFPPLRSPAQVAGAMAAGRPDLARLLRTGADLAEWDGAEVARRGASPTLVEAQVEAAARAAREIPPARAVPARLLARPLGAFAAATLLVAGLWVGNPGGTAAVWARVLTGGEPEPVAVGNLVITYAPPAYTGLPLRRVEGAEGTVRAYPGTRVTLSGVLSRPVDRGQWEGPGGQVVPLGLQGRSFEVSWLVDRPGPYRLRFFVGRKEAPSEFGTRPVQVLEDTRPRVEMDEPGGDLEIPTDQEVVVRFRAADDFGVERVEVVLQGDAEVRIPASVEPGPAVAGEVRFLPLALPELGAGAHLRVEALDGDTVRGPKAGSSRSVYVSFLDKRRLAAEIEGLEDRLLESLLSLLADLLEAEPGDAQALAPARDRARDLLRLLDQLADRVRLGAQEGSLGATAVLGIEAGLRGALVPFANGSAGTAPVVESLEREILFLDRLLRSMRMEQALTLGDELAALQRSLFDDLQKGEDPEALLERVQQIQELLSEMARQLAKGSREMPDEFANADAVRNMPRSELQSMLDELRKALEAGDRDRARELAEKLLETLQRWMAALENAASGAAQAEIDPLLSELGEVEDELQSLASDQERLLGETRDLAAEASARAMEQIRSELDDFLARQEARLRAVEEAARRIGSKVSGLRVHAGRPMPPKAAKIPDVLEARQRLGAAAGELRESLREDWARAREAARALEGSVDALRESVLAAMDPADPARPEVDRDAGTARENVRAILDDLERLARRRLRAVTPEEGRRLQELARRQQGLGERTGELAQRLAELGRQTPLLGGDAPKRLRSVQGDMGEASGKLGGRDPFGAVPPETRALEGLAEVGSRLRQARRRMLQGMEGGGFQLVRRPTGSGQGREVDRSPVEIPREAQARELRAFREEVLRAMREGRFPKGYEDEVEGYYERLIR